MLVLKVWIWIGLALLLGSCTTNPIDGFFSRSCSQDLFVQPSENRASAVDILFVADTSGSLDEERAKIANAIDRFVGELPDQGDIRIGVMLAHAESVHSGTLFEGAGDPVLDYSSLPIDDLKTDLREKLENPVSESELDGGETGMISLFNATQTANIDQIKAQGFFRDNAALSVIFIADENDICATYPPGVTPVADAQTHAPTGLPLEEWVRQEYCDGINETLIAERLRALKGEQPLIVNGIIYIDQAPLSGENEIGWGYNTLIDNLNGTAVDLAPADLGPAMEALGRDTGSKISLLTEFKPTQDDVVENTIQVTVDGQVVPFQWSPIFEEVFISPESAGGPNSQVRVEYCTVDDIGERI